MAVLFHIDMNAYFASAHLLDNPSLKGKPLAVCVNKRGSVVTTASYEARAFGINSAMPLSHAKRLCPDLITVDIDFPLYNRLSQKFLDIVRRYTPLVQQASVDECYADVTQIIKSYDKPLDLAIEIQSAILNELSLPCSIGVAPNKFLAKMASDMKKPMGITVLRIREVKEKLWPLPIEDFHGIGRKTIPRLKEIDIHTIGDLAQKPRKDLDAILGLQCQTIIDKANGIDLTMIELNNEAKSMGQSKTFHNAMYDDSEIRQAINVELTELVRRLKAQELMGRTVSFAIRMDNFKNATRSVTLDHVTNNFDTILENVSMLYDEFDGMAGVEFISVTLSNLVKQESAIQQLNIFEMSHEPTTFDMISKLNESFKGGNFMTPRDLLKKKEGSKHGR